MENLPVRKVLSDCTADTAVKYNWLLTLLGNDEISTYLSSSYSHWISADRQTDDAAADKDILIHARLASVQNMTINAFLMPLLLCAVLYQGLLPPTMDI